MGSKKLAVALAQYTIRWQDKIVNQKHCAALVKKAVLKKADVIIFPETTLTGFDINEKWVGEDFAKSKTIIFFRDLARANKIAIIFSALFNASKNRGYNAALVIDNKGKIVCRYNKIHPFSFSGEHKKVLKGSALGKFVLKGISCAVVICYDIRFPGLFSALGKRRPEILFVLANWPASRRAHWRTLLPARALDLQSFVIAVNTVGKVGDKMYAGDSAIYSPRGEEVLNAKNIDGLYIYTIDTKAVKDFRNTFSSLADQRHDLYGKL